MLFGPDGHGGVIPIDRERAKAAELVTLPMDVQGKSCKSCDYFVDAESRCVNAKVDMPVTEHQACRWWANPGTFKTWK